MARSRSRVFPVYSYQITKNRKMKFKSLAFNVKGGKVNVLPIHDVLLSNMDKNRETSVTVQLGTGNDIVLSQGIQEGNITGVGDYSLKFITLGEDGQMHYHRLDKNSRKVILERLGVSSVKEILNLLPGRVKDFFFDPRVTYFDRIEEGDDFKSLCSIRHTIDFNSLLVKIGAPVTKLAPIVDKCINLYTRHNFPKHWEKTPLIHDGKLSLTDGFDTHIVISSIHGSDPKVAAITHLDGSETEVIVPSNTHRVVVISYQYGTNSNAQAKLYRIQLNKDPQHVNSN